MVRTLFNLSRILLAFSIMVLAFALAGCYTPEYYHPPGIPLRWDSEKKMSVPDYGCMSTEQLRESCRRPHQAF